ncbi:UNVERIFIED_CONTAM: hypothetical protein Sangu_0188100 [Sesamum angustifolium]|uniref:Myb/SANT-like domain-containing protein n=1 Tax=Sesamum angustifolium TaxID=2727405 RepID=A0AAW2RMB6_9LAMI
MEGKFVYALSGWEGSAADGHILRDAIHRPTGLKVPTVFVFTFVVSQGITTFVTIDIAMSKMNMGDDEGSSKSRICRGKLDKGNSRRTWSQHEEEVLVSTLRTIITNGWKSENEFQFRYLGQLETLMLKHFPNTDLRVEPYINLKIHVWKKFYGTLSGMMSKSGFGWDDNRCMVTVDSQDVWDDYCKIDPTTRTMRYKTWSFFLAWRGIFGKDRANGEVTRMRTKRNDSGVALNNQVPFDPIVISTTSNKKSSSSTKTRQMTDTLQDDDLSNAVSNFCESANIRLGELSKKLFVDYDEVEK